MKPEPRTGPGARRRGEPRAPEHTGVKSKDVVMLSERARDAGFCAVDSNADLVAEAMVRRLRDTAAEMEASVNRLYRGRDAFTLADRARTDLERSIRRLAEMAEALREIQRAQDRAPMLQAAE